MSNAYKDWKNDHEQDRERARTAKWCCASCGDYWGEESHNLETFHKGCCEVCLAENVTVGPVRHWNYLFRAKQK